MVQEFQTLKVQMYKVLNKKYFLGTQIAVVMREIIVSKFENRDNKVTYAQQ